MKKWLVILLVFTLVGCGAQAEDPPIRVGLCVPTANASYAPALQKELERNNCYVNILAGKNDQSLQNRQVTQLVHEGYDLLIIEPVIRLAADALLAGLESAKIPAILLNTPQQATRTNRQVCQVAFSEQQAGALQGQCVLNTPDRGDLNGDGRVACAYLAGPEDLVNTSIHVNACLAALRDQEVSVELLAQVYGDDSPARGQALTEGLLDRFGNAIEVLFCGNSQLALGALDALRAAGQVVNEDIYVVCIGDDPEIVRCVEAGTITGAVVADYATMAVRVTEAAEILLSGRSLPQITAPYTLKQAQNIRGKNSSSCG